MQSRAFAREVWRNLQSGTSRFGLFVVLGAAALCVLVLVDVVAIAGNVSAAGEFRRSGAAVSTLTIAGRVDGRACEALADLPDVVAAGAMRQTDVIELVTLPNSPVDLYETTPGFARVLDSRSTGSARGVVVSEDVAEAGGAETVPLGPGVVPIQGVFAYPADGRRAGFGWAILSPGPASDGLFDECWVLSWPGQPELRTFLLGTVARSHGSSPEEQPEISQLNTRFGSEFTGAATFRERPTLYAPHIAFLLAVLLGAVSVWLRRVELASNLHAGAGKLLLAVQSAVEVAAWSVPVAALGWSSGMIMAATNAASEISSLGFRSGQISFVFLAGAVVGGFVTTLLVREEDLWRYVRSR